MIYGKVFEIMTEREKQDYTMHADALRDCEKDKCYVLNELCQAQLKVIAKMSELAHINENLIITQNGVRSFETLMESKYAEAFNNDAMPTMEVPQPL